VQHVFRFQNASAVRTSAASSTDTAGWRRFRTQHRSAALIKASNAKQRQVLQAAADCRVAGDHPTATSVSMYPCNTTLATNNHWSPMHTPGEVQQRTGSVWVYVPRGGNRKYHQFEQCGSLQWGHARVTRSEAIAHACFQCKRCAEQTVHRTWPWLPQSPRHLRWSDYVDTSITSQCMEWF
jgi:hypothetical protein